MEKGQITELKIEDMLYDGRAFGRCGGCAVFVSGSAVPGDTVKVQVTKAKKSSAEAKVIQMTESSPDRIESACQYSGECGGCTLRELSYDAQKKLKTEQVRSKLKRLGGLEDPKVNEIIGAESLDYYRNKAVFAIGPHGEVGFKKGKSNHVIDIDDCLLQSDAAMVCADALRYFLKETGTKGIKQLTVRTAFGTGEVMAVIDVDRVDIPKIDMLCELFDDAVNSLSEEATDDKQSDAGSVNFVLKSVTLIHQGKCRIIAGLPTITEEFRTDSGAIRYEISPQSFFQVNPQQMMRLYNKAAEYADLKGGETVLDLYCGAGTIGIWLLDDLRSRDKEAFDKTHVIGIESAKPAIIDANRNSVINNIINTRYICGKAEEELPGMMGLSKLYKWNEVNERVEREPEIRIEGANGSTSLPNIKRQNESGDSAASGKNNADASSVNIERIDVAVLDPPRAGCDEALLSAAVTASPGRIVYVSCDPATLARDIKYLCAHGYEFIEATPVDQFPWTSHVEVVAGIQKKKA